MAGEKTGQDMREDSHAYEKQDVMDNVAKHLEEFGGEPSIPAPPASSAGKSEPTSEPEPKVEPTETDEPTLNEPAGQAAGEGEEKPALPDNYYRAAIHQDWTPEEIADFYNKDPERAVKTFGKIYESTNNLSQQFAQAGRAAIELERRKTQAKQVPSAQPQVVEQKPKLDVDKLRKQYEDDPFGATLELMNFYSQKPEPAPQATPTPQVIGDGYSRETFEEDMAILQQLNQFFGAEDMEVYEEFYGSTKDDNGMFIYDWQGILSPGQYANRQAVAVLADQIIAGAELQSQQMSVAQGLELAHLAVTRPMSETVIREKIISDVKKRSKGITLKPSGARTPSESSAGGETKSYEQAEINVGPRLKALREGRRGW